MVPPPAMATTQSSVTMGPQSGSPAIKRDTTVRLQCPVKYKRTVPTILRLQVLFLFISFCLIHFIIPFVKFGPPYLGKAAAAATAALPSPEMHAGSFFVSIIYHSHMDYRIFNVCM